MKWLHLILMVLVLGGSVVLPTRLVFPIPAKAMPTVASEVDSSDVGDWFGFGDNNIVVDSSGYIYVIYAISFTGGAGFDGRINCSQDQGLSWLGPISFIDLDPIVSLGYISVDIDALDVIHMVYQVDTGVNYEIHYRQYDIGAATLGAVEVVATSATNGLQLPVIYMDTTGIVHTGWVDYDGMGTYAATYRERSAVGVWAAAINLLGPSANIIVEELSIAPWNASGTDVLFVVRMDLPLAPSRGIVERTRIGGVWQSTWAVYSHAGWDDVIQDVSAGRDQHVYFTVDDSGGGGPGIVDSTIRRGDYTGDPIDHWDDIIIDNTGIDYFHIAASLSAAGYAVFCTDDFLQDLVMYSDAKYSPQAVSCGWISPIGRCSLGYNIPDNYFVVYPTVDGGNFDLMFYSASPDPITNPTVATNVVTGIAIDQADLNATLTDDGNGFCSFKFEYDYDGGTPYSFDTDWSGTVYSTGNTYSYTLVGLSPGTLYYVRVVARNSLGFGYGTEVSFTTLSTTPVIITMDPINISVTTARLRAYVVSDGGDHNSYVRFQYDTTTGPPYADVTGWISGYGTGEYATFELSGLTFDTDYYVNAQIYTIYTGSGSPEWGGEIMFHTRDGLDDVDNFVAISTVENEVGLTWYKPYGAQGTRIQRKVGTYPVDFSDGIMVYQGVESAYDDGYALVRGTTYYYSAWGYADGGWESSNAAYATITTMATALVATNDAPVEGGWFSTMDSSHLSNMPFYENVNACANSFAIPLGAFWLLLVCIVSACVGVMALVVTKASVAALAAAMIVLVIGNMAIGVPLWIVFIVAVIGAGVTLAWSRI